MKRASHFLAATALALFTLTASAQQHVNQEKGFSADKVYDFHSLDSVSMFNGNLNVRIPLGQTYHVGTLSYGFGLTYNSNVWRWTYIGPFPPAEHRGDFGYSLAHVDPRSNAGMGWTLSLGRLMKPGDAVSNPSAQWVYESPDGADHSFKPNLHGGSTPDPVYTYSRDNSYMRMHSVSSTRKEIELPDGSVQVFQSLLPGTSVWPVSTNSSAVWRLTSIHDAYGTTINIGYSENSTYGEIWTVADGTRTHSVYFKRTNSLPYETLLDHVILQTFGGAVTSYDFAYDTDENVEISRPADDGDVDSQQHPILTCATRFLKTITLPPDSYGTRPTYSMTLAGSTESAYDKIRVTGPNGDPGVPNALLKRLQLPTGGALEWTYDRNAFPEGSADNPAHTHSDAVVARSWKSETGADLGTTVYRWFLSTATCYKDVCSSTDPHPCSCTYQRQLTAASMSTVGDGLPVTTISYFDVYAPTPDKHGDFCPDEGWLGGDYSLPFTRYAAGGAAAPYTDRFLSTEVRTGIDLATFPNQPINGPFPAGHLLRATYVGYGADPDAASVTIHAEGRVDKNRREARRTTLFVDDTGCAGVCHNDSNALDFDSWGHYRLNTASSNFPNDQPQAAFTNYPAQLDGSNAWILNTYAEQCSSKLSDNSAVPTAPIAGCSALADPLITKSTFDRTTGFLTSKRVLVGSADGATDVNVAYDRDAYGNITSETYTGGDALPTGEPATFRLDHALTYDGHVVLSKKTTYAGVNAPVADEVYDRWTGLLALSRDSSGRATSFTYDASSRLTGSNHPDGGTTQFQYRTANVAGSFSPAMVDVVGTGTNDEIRQSYTYDAIGRITLETALLPQVVSDDASGVVQQPVSVGVRTTYYPQSGAKKSTSVQAKLPDLDSAATTRYEAYDAFGNPTRVVAPDNSVTTSVHTNDGVRELTRTATITTVSGPAAATTVERYDAGNHLVEVVEPSGVVTTYGYDAAEHLISVDTPSPDGLQQRRFSYDHRGFLTSETHPELGANGNGSAFYGGYDARGHAHSKRFGTANGPYGPLDLKFSYDAAERLIGVGAAAAPPASWLKTFVYADANAGSNYIAGKLASATRHNRVVDTHSVEHDVAVAETYVYGDAAGRPTVRTTSVTSDSQPMQTFVQNVGYDRFGAVRRNEYPICAVGVCAGAPQTAILNNYVSGTMTGVAGEYTNGGIVTPTGYGTLTYGTSGLLTQVRHIATGATQSVVGRDTQTEDPSGIARPASISFNDYCYGPAVPESEPHDASVVSGARAKLHLTPIANATYQWFRGAQGDTSNPVAGETSSDYTTAAITQPSSFWVRVSDTNCSTDSRTAVVTPNNNCAAIAIDQDPQDTLIASGTTTQLSVVAHASNDSQLSYTWYEGAPPDRSHPAGNTNTTFTTPVLNVASSYWVEVRASSTCMVESAPAHVRVCNAPVIAKQPDNQWAAPPADGQSVTLTTAIAADGEGLRFEWYNAQNQLQPESGATFSRAYSSGTLDEEFYCKVTNVGAPGVPASCQGTVTSQHFHFTIANCDTGLEVSPAGQQLALFPGRNFTVDLHAGYANGSAATFDWRHGFTGDGESVPVQTNGDGSLLVNHTYDVVWCHVTHGSCDFNTAKSYASIDGSCPLPPLTVSPASARVVANQGVTLSVISDWPTVTYQWYRGMSGDTRDPIAGGTHSSVRVNSLSGAIYWCRVTDGCGRDHRDSDTIPVTVAGTTTCAPILIETQPVSGSMALGTSYALRVIAHSEVPFTISWFGQGNATPLYTGSAPFVVTPSVSTTYYAELTASSPAACASKTTTLPVLVQVSSCASLTITTQPASTTARPNETATFSVSANATSYQWYEGAIGDTSQAVAAGNSATITVARAATTTFWVRMTSACGAVDSTLATLTVCNSPVITSQPIGGDIQHGDFFPLGIGLENGVSCEWHAGVPSDDQGLLSTSPHFWIHPDFTSYYFARLLGGTCGNTTSDPILVTVCTTPSISQQPADQKIFGGKTVTLSVAATASGPAMSYTWYDVAADAVGTGPTFVTPPLTSAHQYFVRITSGACTVDSDQATIDVCELPEIAGGTGPYASAAGASVTIAAGIITPPDGNTFTWYAGESGDLAHSVQIAGPSSASTTLVAPLVTTHYWAQVARGGCTSRTPTIVVNVCKPTITTQPSGTMMNSGASWTMSVAASGSPLTYQWYVGAAGNTSAPVGGGTTAQLTVNPTVTTSYWARVSGSCSSAGDNITDTTAATVTVCNGPTISPAPAGSAIASGQTATLSVTATGAGLQYAWYVGAPGTTTTLLASTASIAVAPQSTTAYWVRVTDGCGNHVDSGAVTVTVCTTPAISAQPLSQSVFSGASAQLSVTATATGPAQTYRWYLGTTGDASAPVAGATASTMSTGAVTSARNYWVRVTSGACTADSSTATISVCPLAQNIAGAPDVNITPGATGRLQLPNYGAGFTYNWFQGVSGNTATPLGSNQVANYLDAAPATTTQYWAQVVSGSCISNTATMAINVCKPVINTQPVGGLLTTGTAKTLSVTASPSTVTYQWYVGAAGTTTTPVSGGTTSSISVTPASTTSYWCRVTGCSVNADTIAATVTVCSAPVINPSPTGSSIVRGQTASLTVAASGTSLQYAWYSGNPGTTTTLVASTASTTVAPQNTTTYWVRVTDGCGNHVDSGAVVVTVCTTPTISTQPASQSVFSGNSAQLSVTAAAGAGPALTYQWYLGASGDASAPVSGATASTMSTGAVTAARSYWVRVSGGACSADSSTATISVCQLPQSVAGGADVNIAPGATGRLQVTNYGAGFTYNWFQGASGNTSTPLAQNQTVSYLDASPAVTTQYWTQVVSGSCVSITTTMTINVCKPVINTQPVGGSINSGTAKTLSVTASPSTVTYQWYVGASGTTTTPVSGGTTATISVTPASTTTYWCRVTGCSVAADTAAATVTVCNPPAISSPPPSSSIVRGQTAPLSVVATGTGLQYTWYSGTPGTTTTTVATTVSTTVSPLNTTTYWVRVTDACGNYVDSGAVTVTVCTSPSISTQPVSQSVFSGSSAQLSVAATAGAGPTITYQWYVGNSGDASAPVSGATAATMSTGAMTTTRSYWLRVSGGACAADSSTATITVCALPQSVAGGADVNITPGASGHLQLPSYGVTGLTYNWFQGASGNTSSPLGQNQVANYLDAAPAATTQYWAQVVTGSCVSNTATMTINVCKPVISTQPSSVSILSGGSATLTVNASPATVTYQWYIGTTGTTTSPVTGATSKNLMVTPSATTTYWCRVTGCSVNADSNAATVTVCQPPAITQQPASGTFARNTTATATVTATGPNLQYQWYIGAPGNTTQPLSGASTTTASLSIYLPNTEHFWVRISNACGSVNSAEVWLSVQATISAQSGVAYLNAGSHFNASVTASGTYLQYQWYDGSYGPVGTNSPVFVSAPITVSNNYFAYVMSGVATTMSMPVSANICTGPQVATPLVSGNGSCKTISVSVADPGNVCHYDWYKGESGDISQLVTSGAWTDTIQVCPTATGRYWVRVVGTDLGYGDPNNNYDCYTDSTAVTVNP
jgi:YD repeat-containing protein